VLEERDFDLYLTSAEWFEEAGLGPVSALHGRVLASDAYERRWIRRHRRISEEAG
jgi:hypothetical protein